MTRVLSIAHKLLSLRGQVDITDDAGAIVYQALGEFAFVPTWRITESGSELLRLRRRVFAWAPTWDVAGQLGAFVVKRKIFSLRRRYRAIGGAVDGAEFHGSFLDFRMDVHLGGDTIARARSHILTMRDRHEIEVLGEPVLLVVLAMVILLLDRRQEDEHSRKRFES